MAKHINPHGALLRKGRISIPGQIYHLTTVTDKRRPLFADWELAQNGEEPFRIAPLQ